MRYAFCTLFDKTYQQQGLALLQSLRKHQPDIPVYILAMDERVMGTLLMTPFVFPMEQVAAKDYWDAVQDRDAAERAWTITPYWMDWILRTQPVDALIYLDADSYLFDNMSCMFREFRKSSVGIVPHRFPERLKWREEHNGKFNVNVVYLRNDQTGRACAELWKDQCLYWCYRRTQRTKNNYLLFGDQAYLDGWEELFNATVLENTGVNLAPWNQEQYHYTFDNHLYVISHSDKDKRHVSRIDRLCLYHFHEMRSKGGSTWDYGGYKQYFRPEVLEHIYKPYVKQLNTTG